MDKLNNTRYFPHNKQESIKMQEYAFSLGYMWFFRDSVPQFTDSFLFFSDKAITRMDLTSREDFENHQYREIYKEDIFDDHLINHEEVDSFKQEMKKYE